MLKKTITYTDYNGVERTEDHYFNLSKAELIELEASINGGYSEYLKRISAANDAPSLFRTLKELIMKSYGEKDIEGKRFIKKDINGRLLAEDFIETEAYSVLLTELFDPIAAANFVNGIIPAEMLKQTQETAN